MPNWISSMTRLLSGLQNQGSEEVKTKFNEVIGIFNNNMSSSRAFQFT